MWMDIVVMQVLWYDVGILVGDYFFGDWLIVDVFFILVVSWFCSYVVELYFEVQGYCEMLLLEKDYLDWYFKVQLEDYLNFYENFFQRFLWI